MQISTLFLVSISYAILANSVGTLSGIAIREHQKEFNSKENIHGRRHWPKRRKVVDKDGSSKATIEKRI